MRYCSILGLFVQGSTMLINSSGNDLAHTRKVDNISSFLNNSNNEFTDELIIAEFQINNLSEDECSSGLNHSHIINLLDTEEDKSINNNDQSDESLQDNFSQSEITNQEFGSNLIQLPTQKIPINLLNNQTLFSNAQAGSKLADNMQNFITGEDNISHHQNNNIKIRQESINNRELNIFNQINTKNSNSPIKSAELMSVLHRNASIELDEIPRFTKKEHQTYPNQLSTISDNRQEFIKINLNDEMLNSKSNKNGNNSETKANNNDQFLNFSKDTSSDLDSEKESNHTKSNEDSSSSKKITFKVNNQVNTTQLTQEIKPGIKTDETIIRFARPKDFADVTFKIINNINSNSTSTAKIILNPPALGKILIAIRLINENLSVNIKIENKDVQRIIENQIPYLKDKLQLTGLKIENFELNTSTNRGADTTNNGQGKHQNGNQKDNLMREFIRTFKEYSLATFENENAEPDLININHKFSPKI